MQVQNVERCNSLNQSEETLVIKDIFDKIANSVYLTVKRSNLIEYICIIVTFVSIVRTLQNLCIHKI